MHFIGSLLVASWTSASFLALCPRVIVADNDAPPCIAPSLLLPQSNSFHPPKVVIAHRGASAHLPEHTLPAYRLALELGADYIEPDLVATRDRKLIAIHSMDLSITTDVEEKFPDRSSFSKYLNRTGFFAYNFDLSEIQTLSVRQRLPAARSKSFDGLFGIPTLTEILETISTWANDVDPLLFNTTFERPFPGVYAELKDHPWLLEDTNVDLVDVLFEHIEQEKETWESVILSRLCSTKQPKIYDVRLPPLVIQSFDSSVLEKFTNQWKDTFSASLHDRPVPPRILLVGDRDCLEEEFWYNIGSKWKDYMDGIGPDKRCLANDYELFMEPALKHELVVHPWTQRPELEFIENSLREQPDPFPRVQDETHYLFCTVGVHGVFSETVSAAVVAANIPCDIPSDEPTGADESPLPAPPDGATAPTPETSDKNLCFESETEANLYVGLATFVLGAFLSALISMWWSRRSTHSRRGRRQLRIPTVDVTEDDLELTEEESEDDHHHVELT